MKDKYLKKIGKLLTCSKKRKEEIKKQLESERMVAEREGYSIQIVRGDMTKPLPFPDGQFDVIFHPVSNCYIEDVYQVWRECYRILKPGGILLAGMDNGFPTCSTTIKRLWWRMRFRFTR